MPLMNLPLAVTLSEPASPMSSSVIGGGASQANGSVMVIMTVGI